MRSPTCHVMHDGACRRRDGRPLTIDEVLDDVPCFLTAREEVRRADQCILGLHNVCGLPSACNCGCHVEQRVAS